MSLVKLRTILQEGKPEFSQFQEELEKQPIKKGDADLLLRKVVESKLSNFSQFCDALVKKGANVNFADSKDNISNLMVACSKGNYEMVKALLRYKELNLQLTDKRKLNALFYAIDNKSREDSENILRLLLERQSALINKQANNQTLLIAAIGRNKVELIKLLLEKGADPNWQVPDTGNTALHDAVKQFKSKQSKAMTQIIRLLLTYGGDSLKKNKQQKTVYDYTEKSLQEYEKIEKQVIEQQQTKTELLLSLNSEDQISQFMDQTSTLFDKYEGVNQNQQDIFLDQGQAYLGLTNQILAFQKECVQIYDHAKQQMNILQPKLEKILSSEGLKLQIYGSFATGLWIRQSNVDILLVRKDYDGNSSGAKQTIEKVYEILKKASFLRSITLYTRNVRIPMIKAQVADSKNIKALHFTMMDRGNNGRAVTRFIFQQKQNYPLLQPIFFVVKHLTYNFRLSEPKNGGLRTYALIIMLLSCIAKWNQKNLGKFLIDFLYYFGFYYEYQYEVNMPSSAISMGLGGQRYFYDFNEHLDAMDQYVMALHIFDPINSSNNVGKHVKANQLQRMFRTAYIALHLNILNEKRLGIMFETKNIIL